MGWLIPAICVSLIVVAVLCGSVWYAWKHRDKICVSATPRTTKEELLPSSPPVVLESREGEEKGGGGFPGNQGRRISTVDSSNLDSILQGLQGAEDECELDVIQESEHQESEEAAIFEKEESEQQEEAAMLKKEELQQQEEADMLNNKYLQYDQRDVIVATDTKSNEIEGRVEEQGGDREEENKEENKEEENVEENEEENKREGEEELMFDPVENGDFSTSEEGEKVDQDDLVTMATDQNKTGSITTAAEKETDPASSECISQTVENEDVLDERTVLAALADSLRGTEVDSEDDWESEYKSEPSGSESAKNSESAENSEEEDEEFVRRAERETYKSEESECGKKKDEEEVSSSDVVESGEIHADWND